MRPEIVEAFKSYVDKESDRFSVCADFQADERFSPEEKRAFNEILDELVETGILTEGLGSRLVVTEWMPNEARKMRIDTGMEPNPESPAPGQRLTHPFHVGLAKAALSAYTCGSDAAILLIAHGLAYGPDPDDDPTVARPDLLWEAHTSFNMFQAFQRDSRKGLTSKDPYDYWEEGISHIQQYVQIHGG